MRLSSGISHKAFKISPPSDTLPSPLTAKAQFGEALWVAALMQFPQHEKIYFKC